MAQAELESDMVRMYGQAARMWGALRREFLYALERVGNRGSSSAHAGASSGTAGAQQRKQSSPLWRAFWAAHQRFFRHMCMASKVGTFITGQWGSLQQCCRLAPVKGS